MVCQFPPAPSIQTSNYIFICLVSIRWCLFNMRRAWQRAPTKSFWFCAQSKVLISCMGIVVFTSHHTTDLSRWLVFVCSLVSIGTHILCCCVLLPSGSSEIQGFQYRKGSYQLFHCAKMLCWAAVSEIWTVICTLNIIHCWFLDDCLLAEEAGRWFLCARLMAFPFITAFLRAECSEINLHILKD